MEMIMAVLVFCASFFGAFVLSLFSVLFCGDNLTGRKIKNPLVLRVGWNFSFIALTTNSPLASYLGGTQNRNQYE